MRISPFVLGGVFGALLGLLIGTIWKRFFPDEGIDVSKDYVADLIQEMIDGNSQGWDWDDFTSIPIKDPYLDGIRQRCARLWKEYPPDRKADYCGPKGIEIMQSYVAALRSTITGD